VSHSSSIFRLLTNADAGKIFLLSMSKDQKAWRKQSQLQKDKFFANHQEFAEKTRMTHSTVDEISGQKLAFVYEISTAFCSVQCRSFRVFKTQSIAKPSRSPQGRRRFLGFTNQRIS
jgi:hypothetical protein